MPPSPKPWLDFRAALLALLLAVAAALPLVTTSATRRDFYFFDVTLTSDAAGMTQFFWDLGHGNNESDSSVQPLRIERKPVVYRFMVPPGVIRGFRFDPIDRPGRLTISHARIVDIHGHLVREFKPGEFKPNAQVRELTTQGDTLTCVTTPDAYDPFLDLALTEPLFLPVLSWMKFRAALPLGLSVLLFGLLLSSPRLTGLLQPHAASPARWLAARPRTTVLLVATLAVAVQSHPVIFGGRSFVSPNNGSLMLYSNLPTLPKSTDAEYADTMGSDVGAMLFNFIYYPMVQRDALLQHGELPLWNRYDMAGEPLLGQGQSMFGDPFNVLTILADGAGWAWDVRFLIAHWLLAAGTGLSVWLLTRHLAASVLVTIGAGFIGFFTFRINHPANFSVGYAPWILVAWVGLIQTRTPRGEAGWLGVLLLANWIEFSSGTMKEASMLMACLNLAGVLLVLFTPLAASHRMRLLLLATATGGVFLLLAAPLWMSFVSTLRHSVTAYDVPQAQTFSLTQFIGIFDDMFYRQKWTGEWVVAPALNALFLLGVLAWLVSPSAWRRDRTGLALLVAAVVPWAFAFGIVPPAVIVKIPFIGNIWHVGNTFSCPLLILFAVLAGCGFREALTQAAQPGWWWRFSIAVGLAAGLAGAFYRTTRDFPKSAFFEGYAPALALAALALPLGARWVARSKSTNALFVVLILAIPLLLWRHSQYLWSSFNHYVFTPGARVDFHAPSAAAEVVNRQGAAEPSRVIGLQNNLFPDYNVALHWESLYGVDAVRSGVYLEFAAALHMGRVWQWDGGTAESDAITLQPVHDLLNVSHYLADHTSPPHNIPRLQLLAQRDLDVYVSPSAWPRAFFTDRLAVYDQMLAFVALVYTGDGRPFAAVQSDENNPPVLSTDLTSRTVRAASGYRLTSNTTSFVIDAPGPGVAVLTETFYPGDFKVTMDGSPTGYFRVNHAFKGVRIDRAGRHVITFAYWPEHFTLSLILAAAGFVLATFGSIWLWRRDGKKSSIQAFSAA
jgi:hypothetical protein